MTLRTHTTSLIGPLQALRFTARSAHEQACATRHLAGLNPDNGALIPAASGPGHAAEAIMLTIRSYALHSGPDRLSAWEKAVRLTRELLYGRLPLTP